MLVVRGEVTDLDGEVKVGGDTTCDEVEEVTCGDTADGDATFVDV